MFPIARLVEHGSLGGVQKALGRLVEQGIVLADAYPSATLFTLNRDHLAAGPVIEFAQLNATLVARLKGAIRAWALQPQHAYLFGSAARQDGDAANNEAILDSWQRDGILIAGLELPQHPLALR